MTRSTKKMAASPRGIDWNRIAEQYAAIDEDRSRIVFPAIIAILQKIAPGSVLDFGGGDGRFVEALLQRSTSWPAPPQEVAMYDPSTEMRRLARRRLADRPGALLVEEGGSAWRRSWDAVTFNAVWMGLTTEQQCVETLGKAVSVLSPGGCFVASVTHPCFRDRVFKTFSTEYDMRRYLEEGVSFDVHIYDEDRSITLRDTHWNLDAMTRQLASCGLLIRRLHELGDSEEGRAGSPWLVIEAVKSE